MNDSWYRRGKQDDDEDEILPKSVYSFNFNLNNNKVQMSEY